MMVRVFWRGSFLWDRVTNPIPNPPPLSELETSSSSRGASGGVN